MSNLDVLMKSLNTAVWELSEAFKGLPDSDVWVRPHPNLLSIGEISCHLVYWESMTFLGPSSEGSPLALDSASYYTSNKDAAFQLQWGAEAVIQELNTVHDRCKAAYESLKPNEQDQNPYRKGWTWENSIEYQAFHFAYHTGQIFSVRHLMGHETVDN